VNENAATGTLAGRGGIDLDATAPNSTITHTATGGGTGLGSSPTSTPRPASRVSCAALSIAKRR
jgi:hypothetical protein